MAIPNRFKRVRVLATIALAAVMLYLWSGNVGMPNRDAYLKTLYQSRVGGGSVLRPGAQEAPLQPPLSPESKGTLPHPPLPHWNDPIPNSPPPERVVPVAPVPPVPIQHVAAKTSTTSKAPAALSPSTAPDISSNLHPDLIGQGRKEAAVDTSSRASYVAEHWTKPLERFPISSTIQLPTGTSIPFPRIQRQRDKLAVGGADQEKLDAIKEAALHSWAGYREFAWTRDEVRPISGEYRNPFNAWGATLVDALDTLWIMGLKGEFEDAVRAVASIDFTTSVRSDIPLFETVIRYLGGLVAAYDVSNKQYRVLLDKAVELAEVLYSAFDTPNRVPKTYYMWKPSHTQTRRASTRIVLAEIGTLSMEFTRLSQLTGEPKYYDAIARLTDLLEEWQNNTRVPGIWPTTLDGSGCYIPPDETSKTASKPQPPNTNAIPPGIAVDTDDLTHLGQPGALDDGPQVKRPGDSPSNLEYQGNVIKRKRQLEGEDHLVEYDLDPPTTVGHDVDDTIEEDELDLRAPPPITERPKPKYEDQCVARGLTSSSTNMPETYTLSGAADSAFEYLSKTYMLLGGQVEQYKTMYFEAMETSIEKLLYKPMTEDERDILLPGTLTVKPNYSQPLGHRDMIEIFTPELAHLGCFAGGMFAMGGVLFNEPRHVKIGAKITEGCVWAYNITPTGIMPETAQLMACENTFGECKWNQSAWWAELDPYVESRLKKVLPPPSRRPQLQGGSASSHSGSPVVKGEPVHANLREATNSQPSGASRPQKRQLEEITSDDTPRADLRLPDLPPSIPKTSSSSSSAPSYTPMPVFSHEDYVTTKIADDRLPPGFVHFSSRSYILRPEAIESVFYMYRITGDQHWRDVGWEMWTAIMRTTRVAHGFSAIDDVTDVETKLSDSSESFWLAETLKYFYLLYDEPSTWSLDSWVFNTEAHLFRRPEFEFARGT